MSLEFVILSELFVESDDKKLIIWLIKIMNIYEKRWFGVVFWVVVWSLELVVDICIS